MKCIVVIPTYNESDNIARLVPQIVGFDLHVLIVDDNSPDGTGDIAEQLACGHPRIHVVHRPAKQGLGTAYVRGFQYALEQGTDLICQMDADFSHDPGDLPRLLEAMKDNDVAIGSRYVAGARTENWGLLRKLMSRGANLYTRAILGLPLHDCTSGFKCFRRQALSSLNWDGMSSSGYSFQIEVNYRCWRKGYRLVEIPITFRGRGVGESKMSSAIFFEAVLLVWRLRWERLFGETSEVSKTSEV